MQGELPRSAGFRSRGQPLLTRRDVLVGAFAAGGLMGHRTSFAKASQPGTAVKFEVPANACDCHTHIFGRPDRFPYWPGRAYTPEIALPEEMSALHRTLHIDRVVIVTPSVYGTDNSATLFGMKARGANARGVAVVDEKTSESDLEAMARAGMQGIRLNLVTSGQVAPLVARQGFLMAIDRIQRRHWHIQVYATLAVVSGIQDAVRDSPTRVVFDHFGGRRRHSGCNSGASQTLWSWSGRAKLT